MATKLTTEQANYLYKRGQAIIEGTWRLTTRTTEYDWNPTLGYYEAITTGLRIVHRLGARWEDGRFVRCACGHCKRYPVHAAEVDIY